MVSWQASQCLLPCMQDRHPTYFSWTPKHCINKPFYALRYNLHTPDHKLTQQMGVLVQLVGALLWQDPSIYWTPSQKVHQKWLTATNLRHLHHCTRPSNTWNTTDMAHEWDHPLFPVALRQLSPNCPETLGSGKAVPSKSGQCEAGSPLLLAAEVYLQQLPSTSRK